MSAPTLEAPFRVWRLVSADRFADRSPRDAFLGELMTVARVERVHFDPRVVAAWDADAKA